MTKIKKSIRKEGSERTSGKNAQRMNIIAAQQVAEAIRSTLGPMGMDKMLVDSQGEIIVTNDGVTILREMAIEHPSAKMIVEVAKTQEAEVGDGTTTAVILAGELLKNAQKLLDDGIHPTSIIKGYRLSVEKSDIILRNISEKIKSENKEILEKIAITAMTGKGAELAKNKLAKIVVNAISKVKEKKKDIEFIDSENIKIEKVIGDIVENSELIEGIVIDKERINVSMPKLVKSAKIALLDTSIEIKTTEIEAKIQITNPEQMNAFIDQEEKMILDIIAKIKSTGTNVVFCQKGIDDIAHHFLAKAGIYACRRIKQSDMRKLAKATNGKIVNDIYDLKKEDLGYAGIVEEKKIGDEPMTFVHNCKNAKAVTLLIRGGTEHIVDEVKRAIDDAIGDISATLQNNLIVGGAGASEIEIARNLRLFARNLKGEEKEVVRMFAKSIEIIPMILAKNAGLNPLDILNKLKIQHNLDQKWAGIDVFSGKIVDSLERGVIEPLKIKTQAINSATEVANMILRIDDILLSGPNKKPQNMDIM